MRFASHAVIGALVLGVGHFVLLAPACRENAQARAKAVVKSVPNKTRTRDLPPARDDPREHERRE
jgi:hypothetical protein